VPCRAGYLCEMVSKKRCGAGWGGSVVVGDRGGRLRTWWCRECCVTRRGSGRWQCMVLGRGPRIAGPYSVEQWTGAAASTGQMQFGRIGLDWSSGSEWAGRGDRANRILGLGEVQVDVFAG